MATDLETLSEKWNRVGRGHAKEVQERLAAFHSGDIEDPQLPSDPRDEALARLVLDGVTHLNATGRWREARRLFDPAHEPFIYQMDNQGLPFVVALGSDAALFRRGSSYQAGHLWHVAGEHLTPLPEFLAAAVSPDRKMLALAHADGVSIFQGWQGPEVAWFPWPAAKDMVPAWVPGQLRTKYTVESPSNNLEYLSVSNSGNRIAIAFASGVMVATAVDGKISWRLVLPRHDEPSEWHLEELSKGDEIGFHGDMIHLAMTGDGSFLACGAQDEGHYIFAVDSGGNTQLWAKLGHASEYPHNACFSDDGAWVALNSCHFYGGATIAANVAAVKDVTTQPYDEDPRTPVINPYLRVYASAWLPGQALPTDTPAFALAGASCLTIVGVDGKVVSELIFGSSASSVDYCPESQTLVLGSYSGFLHFLKPAEVDPTGLGWRPPLETKRWCFFKDLPPLQW
jgi:hypothetical protein